MGFILFYKPSKIWVVVALLTWPSYSLRRKERRHPIRPAVAMGLVRTLGRCRWWTEQIHGEMENLLVVWNMIFYDFPFSWECHHPHWRTPSFFRGVGFNHQRIILRHPKILRYAHQIPMLRKWSPHSWYVWSCHGKRIIQYVYLDLRMGDQSGWIAGFLLLIPDTGLEYPLLIYHRCGTWPFWIGKSPIRWPMFRSYVKSSEDMSWFSIGKNGMMIFIDSIMLERAAAKLIWVHDLILLIPRLWGRVRVCLNIFHQLLSESTWMGLPAMGMPLWPGILWREKIRTSIPMAAWMLNAGLGYWRTVQPISSIISYVSRWARNNWYASNPNDDVHVPQMLFLFLYLMVFSFFPKSCGLFLAVSMQVCASLTSPSCHFVPHQYKAQTSCNLCPPLLNMIKQQLSETVVYWICSYLWKRLVLPQPTTRFFFFRIGLPSLDAWNPSCNIYIWCIVSNVCTYMY